MMSMSLRPRNGRRVSSSARPPAVRRHGRRALPRAGRRSHTVDDGAPPEPRRGARPRLQQREHLRQAAAPGARGADRRERWERELLRAGPQGQRRRPGRALDPHLPRWRLHLLVQRAALALRRHHPLAALAGRRPSARPRRSWAKATARSRCSAGSSSTPRPPRASTCTSATGRDAYDVRGRVAHECDLQRERRGLPLPEHAAGLLALHHLDARPGLGDVRLRRAARVPGHAAGRGVPRRWRRARGRAGRCREVAEATADFYHRRRPRPTAFPTGTRARPACAKLGDYLGRPAEPFNDSRAGRQLGGGHRGAGPAAPGPFLGPWREAERAALPPGRPHGGADPLRRALSGADPDHEGLLLHSVYHRPNGWDYVPAGPPDPLRRVESCGAITTCWNSPCWSPPGPRQIPNLL